MKIYKILQTTDSKYKGKHISIDEDKKCVNYIDSGKCRNYVSVEYYHNHIRIINSNYTIHAKLIQDE